MEAWLTFILMLVVLAVTAKHKVIGMHTLGEKERGTETRTLLYNVYHGGSAHVHTYARKSNRDYHYTVTWRRETATEHGHGRTATRTITSADTD